MNYEDMSAWYDGYCFPDYKTVYNPTSVVEALQSRQLNNYWNQTETFEALSVYIKSNHAGLKDTIIELLAGIRTRINISNFTNDMITFKTYEDVLTLLIHLGYLGYDYEMQEIYIPNKEISDEFITAIRDCGWSDILTALEASNYRSVIQMIMRPQYLNQLTSFREKQLIKVITGIRRCGKSTLLELYRDELMKDGVDKSQFVVMNFEDAEFDALCEYKPLYNHIKEHLIPDKMNYIFLDEIQHVNEWQKAVDSLFIKKNCDVYITGSNAYLLSGELATLLSGRYVEIRMLPLSFAEYVSAFSDKTDIARKYNTYLANSSFPYTLELDNQKNIRAYLDGIYTSVILKDVVKRKKVADVTLLENVIRFMFDNIGNLCSIKKIADTLASDGRKISVHNVGEYLSALCDSFILYKAGRYDIKGKQYLKTGEKYYIADIGLRYYLLGAQKADMGRALENVIFLELLRRGYDVRVGKMDDSEVDFIAANENGVEYYQVALTVRDTNILTRELKPLDSISDHNPKYLLTLDDDPLASHNGIKQIYALDWLLA